VEISQQLLADSIGVSKQNINAIESQKYVPSTVLSLKIAGFFKKPVEEIFKLEESD
jgi:putative transcriptional regulator